MVALLYHCLVMSHQHLFIPHYGTDSCTRWQLNITYLLSYNFRGLGITVSYGFNGLGGPTAQGVDVTDIALTYMGQEC